MWLATMAAAYRSGWEIGAELAAGGVTVILDKCISRSFVIWAQDQVIRTM
jgi:hypothetical protein